MDTAANQGCLIFSPGSPEDAFMTQLAREARARSDANKAKQLGPMVLTPTDVARRLSYDPRTSPSIEPQPSPTIQLNARHRQLFEARGGMEYQPAAATAAATAAAANAEDQMRALEETARRIAATGHDTQLLPRPPQLKQQEFTEYQPQQPALQSSPALQYSGNSLQEIAAAQATIQAAEITAAQATIQAAALAVTQETTTTAALAATQETKQKTQQKTQQQATKQAAEITAAQATIQAAALAVTQETTTTAALAATQETKQKTQQKTQQQATKQAAEITAAQATIQAVEITAAQATIQDVETNAAHATSIAGLPLAQATNTADLSFLQSNNDGKCNIKNILEQAVATFKISTTLQSTTLGIHGLMDLYKVTSSKHRDLADIISDESTAMKLRHEIGRYFFSFSSRKGCSPEEASAVTIIHLTTVSKQLDLICRESLLEGIGLTEEETLALANTAAETGSRSGRRTTINQVDRLNKGQWVGILRICVEMACFDANKSKTFKMYQTLYLNIDYSQDNNHIEILASETSLYDPCTLSFGGDFITTYQRFTYLLEKLKTSHKEMANQLTDLIAKETSIDLLTMEWSKVGSLLQQAFARQERLDELNGTNTESDEEDGGKPAVHAMSANGRPTECPYFKKGSCRKGDLCNMSHDTAARAAKTKGDFKEKTLTCKEEGCGEKFKFSVEEQLSFHNRGHSTDPSKCPKHRSKPFGHCDAFKDTGTCKFGDACRFIHTAQTGGQLAIEDGAGAEDSESSEEYGDFFIRTECSSSESEEHEDY